ncbi:MAG TPA: hypothetical protein VHT68_20965, partial [Pseudolabrys sp.]|nr:hypothetical protein [Pseudolabrys sp.]
GNRIPLTVTHRPSATDLQLVLRAHLPQMFGDKREISLNHSGGVLVIGRSAPAAIAPAPLAQIAQEAVEEVMSAPEDVIDAEVVEIEAVEPVEHAAPEMVAEPQPVPRTLPDSPLVRDLMARAQAGPRNPRPSAPVAMMTGSDED